MTNAIHAEKAPDPVGLYPHARRVGNLLFLSGVGPRVKGSTEIPKGIEAQCRSVFDNVRTILESSGAGWTDLVDVTVYLTDMKTFADMNAAWDAWVSAGNTPARATVEVKLAAPQYNVEIMVTAAR